MHLLILVLVNLNWKYQKHSRDLVMLIEKLIVMLRRYFKLSNRYVRKHISRYWIIADLTTFLTKAIPDTRLTIENYADAKFEYLVRYTERLKIRTKKTRISFESYKRCNWNLYEFFRSFSKDFWNIPYSCYDFFSLIV